MPGPLPGSMAYAVSPSPARSPRAGSTIGVEQHEADARKLVSEMTAQARHGADNLQRQLQQGSRLLRLCQEAHEAEDGAPPLRREELSAKLGLCIPWQDAAAMRRRLGDERDSDASLTRDLRDFAAGGEPSAALLEAERTPQQRHDVALGVSAGVVRSYIRLREVTENPPREGTHLLQDLRRTEGVIDALRRQAEQHGSDLQRAIAAEDYPSAWAAQDREVSSIEELVTVHLERIGHLTSADGAADGALNDASKALEELRRDVADGQAEVSRWVEQVDSDAERVKASLDDAAQAHEAEMAVVDEQRQAAQAELAGNAQKQSDVMDRILELYEELGSLVRARGEMVGAAVAGERAAQAKRAAHKQLIAGASQHTALLNDIKARAQTMSANLGAVEDGGERAHRSLSEQVERVAREVAAALLQERRAHHRAFGQLYASLGDRLYSQERREEELEAQAEAARWRLGIARDTMDPAGVTACREQVQVLEQQRAEARESAAGLRRRMDAAAAEATETEEELIKAGDHVESPVEAVRAALSERASRLTAARKAALVQRGEAVDAQAEAAAALLPPPSSERYASGDPPASPSARIPPLSASQSPPRMHTAAPDSFRDASERRRRAYGQRLAALGVNEGSPPPAATRPWSVQSLSPPPRTGVRNDALALAAPSERGASPSTWSAADVPSAEALRRRAEELRKAAEEARARAAQHRAKAEALGRQRRGEFDAVGGTTA
eukprot:TRINITY_DN14899_c0_g4_i1.p1 TRINITY_DN14899_c0_g4~~TRINITY_DN14899_c0_g4_i1.p1  ORF type:complete len:761 (+),score=266.25 TRINITY_DN14899_c0_g4_i1:99-2285(+)